MAAKDIVFLIFSLLGGLALFMYGMTIMSDALRASAGAGLRHMLSRATRNRFAGLGLGTAISSLVQSSAATVMLVGFINAGLMTLGESVPAMLGANVGTTVSMQLISFRLGDYCYLFIGLGFLVSLFSPTPRWKNIGFTILGFGLIFLGMEVMSGAIQPHRAAFERILASRHGDTVGNRFLTLAITAALTGIIQSSGAVIGMCFALARSGVFTSLTQPFPIVMGAHIGTCATALLGSMGTNIEARRSAVSHLGFNIVNSSVCVLLAPLFVSAVQALPGDLVHQIANTHSLTMLFGAVVFLPFVNPWARLVARLLPSKAPPPEPSFLDPALARFPEKAISAAISELQRVARLCSRSMRLTIEYIFSDDAKQLRTVKMNEQIVDEVKRAMRSYLDAVARRALSRRQAILLQNLNRCITDIERIGDHVDELADITTRRHADPRGRFDEPTLKQLIALYEGSAKVLHLVVESLNPTCENFQEMAQKILAARDEYMALSLTIIAEFTEKVASHQMAPHLGVYFREYAAALDRVVRHAKLVALTEKGPYFWLKRRKLERMADEVKDYPLPERVDAKDFLDQLHSENYL